MTVLIQMRDQLEPVRVQGSFDRLAHDINFQMSQGKQLIAVKAADDVSMAINVNNINTIRDESVEEAFAQF